MTRLTTLVDAEAVAARAATEIARDLRSAREARGVAHLTLSGGTTPARTYELLAHELEDWTGIEVWFADERCVGPQDEQSNYRLAQETLLATAQIPTEQVHRMEGELGPERGAERYAFLLGERVPAQADDPARAQAQEAQARDEEDDGPPALDVIVLGIGPDGHVASLFPSAPTLDAGPRELCLPVHDSPKPPPERITLSLAVLRAARACVLLATSASKSDAVAAMLAEPSHHVPASLLRRGRLNVIVDDAAAPPPPLGTHTG
ncbi:MAG TPA: 6-phosphogluconolactonase [Solirubrobacteraceae bacterium]|jgi:6-phosphogluconolactonase